MLGFKDKDNMNIADSPGRKNLSVDVEVIHVKRGSIIDTQEPRINQDKRQSIDKSVQVIKGAFDSNIKLPNPKKLVLLDNELKITPHSELNKPVENKADISVIGELQVSLPKVTPRKQSSCCSKLTSCFKVQPKIITKLSDSVNVLVQER
jgi:hypothetical protein